MWFLYLSIIKRRLMKVSDLLCSIRHSLDNHHVKGLPSILWFSSFILKKTAIFTEISTV